jgi:hypothetical protein
MVPKPESFARCTPRSPAMPPAGIAELSVWLLHPYGYNADGSSIAIERLRDAASRPQRSPSQLNRDSGAAHRAAVELSLGALERANDSCRIPYRSFGAPASR